MDRLGKLNEQQREAALHKDGPLLILAGAGSGKTATMTHRIVNLIENEGVAPWSILAVTFTNKAAAEMRERVEKLLAEGGAPASKSGAPPSGLAAASGGSATGRASSFRPGNSGVWIMTFHAVCLRILRKHADRIGYTASFAVYDPSDQKAVVKRCVKEMGLEPKQFGTASMLSAISKYKEAAKTPAQAREESAQYSGSYKRETAELYARYARILKNNNAMDFDDLILNTVRLFERDEDALAYYRNRWRYILVDEYQDTNQLQYRFVRFLSAESRNLCVVGDDDQCIYQWRGADITNILNFERDFKGTKVIRLEQNYRSFGNILDGANSVIKENRGRKPKALWTDRGKGEKISYRIVRDETAEARFVAEEADRLRARGRSLRDMAVLTRTNAQSRTFEEAFIARGVEYQMLGQTRYYDRKEIKDMLSYMMLVANPSDDVAFMRVVNEPKRGIGAKSAETLAAMASVRGVSILALLQTEEGLSVLSAKARTAASDLAAELVSFASVHEQMKVSELYDELLAKTGYMKALEEKNTVEDDVRMENLLEFRSAIVESEAEDPEIGLSDFMEKIALLSDIDNHDKDADAIVVMTMHAAKGLEFPVVFVPGMEDGLFPSLRALDEADGVEEERRLCYVGMTRAMEKLYLIRALERTMYGRRDYTVESRFLHEIAPETLDEKGDMPGGDVSGYLHRDAWSGGGRGGSGYGRGGHGAGSGSGYGSDGYGADGRGAGSGSGYGSGGYGAGGRGSGHGGGRSGGSGYSDSGRYSGGYGADGYGAGSGGSGYARGGGYAGGGYGFEAAKREITQKADIPRAQVSKGDRVRHRKFGEGLVIDASGDYATVMFDTAGKKKLALDIAPLERMG
jgi:DNA helicase-2/ATP-dependent DNA helicase PcrA